MKVRTTVLPRWMRLVGLCAAATVLALAAYWGVNADRGLVGFLCGVAAFSAGMAIQSWLPSRFKHEVHLATSDRETMVKGLRALVAHYEQEGDG